LTYADTSVFVSFYLPEARTAEVQKRVAEKSGLWATPLHRAEWAHAVAQHVFLKFISLREAGEVSEAFASDCQMGVWSLTDLPETAFEVCTMLARRYGARLPIRTLDSLHVAAALELGADRFWTYDLRQAKLARAAGLDAAG